MGTGALQQERFPTIRNRPKTSITDTQRQYLERQIRNIAAQGGSQQDVLAFLRAEGIGAPEPVSVGGLKKRFLPSGLPGLPSHIPDPENLLGMGMRALQGITFGFGDEMVGSLYGKIVGITARRGSDEYRREMEEWSSKHKKAGFAAEFLGAMMTGSAVGRFAGWLAPRVPVAGKALGVISKALGGPGEDVVRPGMIRRIGEMAGTGAAFGAASGALNVVSEEDAPLTQVLSDRARGMLLGGALGGAFGATVSTAGGIVAPFIKPVARKVVGWSSAISTRFPGMGSPEAQSRVAMRLALANDGVTIDEAIARAHALRASGIRPTVIDLGGENVARLMRDATATRTPAQQRLIELVATRQSDQPARITAKMYETIFQGQLGALRSSYTMEQALMQLRKAQSDPAYLKAFSQEVPVSERMRSILQRPEFQQAWAKGRQLAEDEAFAGMGHGLEVPVLPKGGGQLNFLRKQLEELGFPEDRISAELAKVASGGADFPTALPIRGIDYMKRGLDVVIEKGMKSSGLKPREAQVWRNMLKEVVDEAKTASDDYGLALEAFAGPSHARDAIIVGKGGELLNGTRVQGFMNMHPDQIRKAMDEMNPADRDFARLGFIQRLDELMSNAQRTNEGVDVARRFMGGTLFRSKDNIDAQRIRAIWADAPELAEDIMRMVAGETRASYTASGLPIRAGSASSKALEESMEGAGPVNVRATPGIFLIAAARQAAVALGRGWSRDVGNALSVDAANGMMAFDDLLGYLATLKATPLHSQGAIAMRSLLNVGTAEALGRIQ